MSCLVMQPTVARMAAGRRVSGWVPGSKRSNAERAAAPTPKGDGAAARPSAILRKMSSQVQVALIATTVLTRSVPATPGTQPLNQIGPTWRGFLSLRDPAGAAHAAGPPGTMGPFTFTECASRPLAYASGYEEIWKPEA